MIEKGATHMEYRDGKLTFYRSREKETIRMAGRIT